MTLALQFALLLPVLPVAWYLDPAAARSILLGAMIFVAPNMMFTLYTFRFRGATNAVDIYRSFKFGELVKLILTTIGFALAFKYRLVANELAFFGAFIAMIVLQLFVAGKRLAKTLETED